MKKIIILCYLFLFMFTYSYGQLNDVKTFGTNADDYPLDLLIGHSNEIVISGAYEVSLGQNGLYIVLLDSNGNFKENSLIANSNYSSEFVNSFKLDSGYLFTGMKNTLNSSFKQYLYTYQTTEDLDTVDSTLIFFSDSLRIARLSTLKSDSLLIWYGFAHEINSGITYPLIVKSDQNGNILYQHIGDYQGFSWSYNLSLLRDFEADGYFLFDYQNPNGHHAIHLKEDLTIDSTGHILLADSVMINNIQGLIYQVNDAVMLLGNKIAYVGRGPSKPEDYYVAITDSHSVTESVKRFKGEDNYYLFGLNALTVNYKNDLFIAFADSIDKFTYRFNTFTNKITVAKLDTALNTVWEKRLGWDAYYFQQDIVATDDGGCLVMGSVYDKDTMSFQHDIVLFKLDANGNVTGTHRIENAAGQSLRTYPNPGEDYFNMDIPFAEGEIQVFDQNGKLLFSRTAKPGRNRVDMSRYASGIYFVRLRDDNDQLMGTGKWIKR